jgi:hypothetical protein
MSPTSSLLPTTCDICKETISDYPYVTIHSDNWTDAFLVKEPDHETTAIALCPSSIVCLFCYATRLPNYLRTPIILTETTITHHRQIYTADFAMFALPQPIASTLPRTGTAKKGPIRYSWIVLFPDQHTN